MKRGFDTSANGMKWPGISRDPDPKKPTQGKSDYGMICRVSATGAAMIGPKKKKRGHDAS